MASREASKAIQIAFPLMTKSPIAHAKAQRRKATTNATIEWGDINLLWLSLRLCVFAPLRELK
jgi:hypothetical protein